MTGVRVLGAEASRNLAILLDEDVQVGTSASPTLPYVSCSKNLHLLCDIISDDLCIPTFLPPSSMFRHESPAFTHSKGSGMVDPGFEFFHAGSGQKTFAMRQRLFCSLYPYCIYPPIAKTEIITLSASLAVFRIRIRRIPKFLGLPDLDPPIIKQK